MKGRDAVMSSAKVGGSDDWESPKEVVELARLVLGEIHIDPATTRENPVGAGCWITPSEDGLSLPWAQGSYAPNRTAWLNPPYGSIRPWMAKAAQEAAAGLEIIALVPVRTGARWWQESVAHKAQAICFWKGRLKFKGAPASAPFDSAILYYGDRARAFRRVFEPFGWVVTQ